MEQLKGMPVVKAMTEELNGRITALKEQGVLPKLAVVRVGDREDDVAYERGIKKRFQNAQAETKVVELPASVGQEEFEKVIISLNEDTSVHGILVFRPLPKQLSDDRLKELIAPKKDVDCIGMINAAKVFAGDESAYPPCTAQAVMEMLDYNGVDLTGKRVVVVGRSMVVGKPLAMLLLRKNATVTVCHTRTKELQTECSRADILVACAGSARMIKPEHTNPNQIVIDVGINFVDGVMCGDVDYEAVAQKAAAVSPVPGGVGTVTTSVLLKHTVMSAERSRD